MKHKRSLKKVIVGLLLALCGISNTLEAQANSPDNFWCGVCVPNYSSFSSYYKYYFCAQCPSGYAAGVAFAERWVGDTRYDGFYVPAQYAANQCTGVTC